MKLLLSALALFSAFQASSQVFWTEAFENNCSSDCLAAGVNTGNGPWTVTDNSPTDDGCGESNMANTWYISCAENGQAAGQCGAGCGSDESLHLSSTTLGDLGAAYDAGGWGCSGFCSFGLCATTTDIRVESPTINCTGFSNITISFNYIEGGQTTLDDATLWWFNGTVWAQLTNMAKTTTAGCGGQGLWAAFSMVLPAGANNNPNVKIGFRWVNNDDGTGTDPSFAVDDITLSVVSAGNTITTGTITGSPFCACATVSVPFTSTGTFTAGNVYTAQLSDASGSFAAPVSIGTLNSTANSGTISATIPCNTPSGTGYRIRVISSAPSTTGSDNGVNITVNAPPAAPTASVTTQPTCAAPTGTITVTAPSGANIQYSIGGAYQASGTFSGVTPGTYNVTAQNTTTGCTSTATSVTVNAVPGAPAAPTASVTTQPTCAFPTGTITVTAPSGANIQYSIGGAYQASGTFSGLVPGNYNVTAQDNVTGCTSTATVLVVNTVPGAPATPTASVTTQPTCAVPTGIITITAPTGASIEYSIGGAYQPSGTFSGLVPGNYNVTAQDNVTGCTSTATVLVVNAVPGAPAAPTASVTTQPTCAVPTGTITITAPTGASIEYSIGGAYQASGTFSGLVPGNYNVTAQDNVTGCTSTATVLVVNSVSGAPVISIDDVTDVSCQGDNDGSATISVTGGTTPYTYTWSPSGGSAATASNLTAGTYDVTVTDNTGCSSVETIIIGSPTSLVISGTENNINCSTGIAGSISTSVTGGSSPYIYSWSPNGETTSGINGLEVGNYTLTVTDDNGCSANELFAISLSGSLVVDVTPSSAEIDAGESVPLVASGGTDYIWTPSAGLSCTTCSNPVATPSSTTTYTVSATDDLGCTGTASTTIEVNYECGSLFVPNAFSPNDNGPAVNNNLCVLGAPECIATMIFEIYDRWGEKVFESTDIDNCWDGTFKEEPMNSGVYVYKLIATLSDGTVIEQSGNTVLTR